MPKTTLRNRMLARRDHLAPATCMSWSHRIQDRLLALPEFQRAATLALYSPIRNEVFTEEIFVRALQAGKRVAYPRVRQRHLELVEVADRSELQPGAFRVLEPIGTRLLTPAELDLVVVPGVAFDLAGHRLGYGQGFYDRMLPETAAHSRLVGLGFEFQVVPELPAEPHDVRLHLLLTEERLCQFASQAP